MSQRISSQTQGILLIVAAIALFLLGNHFRAPLIAEHKILVSSEKMKSNKDPFYRSVIVVVEHNKLGAFGYIVNRPRESDGFASGGPVDQDKKIVLATDVDGKAIGTTGLFKIPFDSNLKVVWSIKLKGYVGWSAKQLDSELRRNVWKVIPFDKNLVTQYQGEEMWQAANKVTPLAIQDLEKF